VTGRAETFAMEHPERRTSPLALAAAWLVAVVPLGWGVYQTVVKSLPLFRPGASVSQPIAPR
jgi:hypothetical protein